MSVTTAVHTTSPREVAERVYAVADDAVKAGAEVQIVRYAA
jgi:hypothetical protein